MHKTASLIFAIGCLVMVTAFCGCGSDEIIVGKSKVHPPGWNIINSPDFHGTESLLKGLQRCYQCHGSDLDGGIVDVSCFDCHGDGQDNCVACHGGQYDSTGSPPYGLRGEIDDTSLAVGAHNSHINGSSISNGVACNSCHIVPFLPWDSSHFDFSLFSGPGIIDSIAEITWGGISGIAATWDRNTRTCSGTYCHGNFPRGDNTNKAIWTAENQAACGSCHDDGTDLGQLGRDHQFHVIIGYSCDRCHASTVDSALNIIGPAVHVDGVKTIKFSPDIGTFSDSTCSNPGGCHGTKDWN
jgi:predicted CxxxxCH...CXXCH cytochrome family protein